MEMSMSTGASDSVPGPVTWPKLILFGDSLTQRSFDPNSGLWGALLADKLQRVCDVVSRGFSGYNSKFCRIILPQIFSSSDVSDVKAFVILLGANDSCAKTVVPKSCQYVSLENYRENLETMIDYLQKIGISKDKIILMSPPPYSHEKWTNFCKEMGRDLPNGERQTSQYASACIDLAKKLEIDYVDIYEKMIKEEDWPKYLIDGLHFNPEGGKFVFDLLWPIIEKKIDVEKLLFPVWKEFDAHYNV